MLVHAERDEATDLDQPFRLAFRRCDEAIAIVDLTRSATLIDATDRFLEAWRLVRTGTIGRRLDEIFTKPTTPKLLAVARKAIGAEQPVSAAIGDLATRRVRLSDLDVRAQRLTSDLVSVTVLSRSPLMLARRHALIDDLGLVSGGMIYIYDVARQKSRYINNNVAQLLGHGANQSVALSEVVARVHPDDAAAFMEHVKSFAGLADGEVRRAAFRFRTASGEWRWIDNRAGPFARSAAGEVRRVIGYAFDVTAPRRAMADLADVSAALLSVEEKERRRIARELHDSTAQHLVAADLMLGAYERRLNAAVPDTSLSEARDTLALALREIRTLSFLLHPPRLREQGLAKTLRTFAEGFARRAVLDTRIEIGDLPAPISPDVELALFRVAQEALMNVRRHADADCVIVRLGMAGDDIVLEVEDDGVGIGEGDTLGTGVGVDGMRARLSSLNGTLSIEGLEKGGTRVRAVVRANPPSANNSNSVAPSPPRR